MSDAAEDLQELAERGQDAAPEPALPLLVGESNPYSRHHRLALWPWPENSSGGRLCRKVMLLEPDEYLRRFERTNLCAGRFSPRAAEARAIEIMMGRANLPHHPPVVLLGAKVCRAFNLRYEPFTVWRRTLTPLVVLPHPSGLNRKWNEASAALRARRALQEAGAI